MTRLAPPRPPRPPRISAASSHAARTLLVAARRDANVLSAHDGGGAVQAFEGRFAEAVGAPHAVSTSSGTSAILAMLLAYGVGPGDEVLVNAYGWGSAAGAVRIVGATPVFVDVDESLGFCARDAGHRVTSRTRAVLCTHVFGSLADVSALRALCDRQRLALLFDGSQGLGATRDGKPPGGLGDATAFSLGRRKLVYAGEGGIVVTPHRAVYERLVLATQHPLRARVDVESASLAALIDEGGLSARLHPLAAVIAREELDALPGRAAQQRLVLHRIAAGLSDGSSLTLPPRHPGAVLQSLVLRYRRPRGGPRREEVVAQLHLVGVPAIAGPVRRPLHLRQPSRPGPANESDAPPRATLGRVERLCRHEELFIEDEGSWLSTSSRQADRLARAIRDVDRRITTST